MNGKKIAAGFVSFIVFCGVFSWSGTLFVFLFFILLDFLSVPLNITGDLTTILGYMVSFLLGLLIAKELYNWILKKI